MNPTDLRKAAILVSVLDTASADALLEQMGPAAERVRAAVMDLDDVSEAEQQRVIQEFLGIGGKGSRGSDPAAEVSWDLPDPEAVAVKKPAKEVNPNQPFAFLTDTEPGRFAEHLQRENPQLAAVVLAHLPAEQAADVLQHLPTTWATDVLIRIAQLDEMSPEVLDEIEMQLRVALSPYLRSKKSQQHGAARVGAILQSLPSTARTPVESALARRDRKFVEVPGPKAPARPRLRLAPETLAAEFPKKPAAKPQRPMPTYVLSFTDLAALSDADWQRLLSVADESLILLAFSGAEPNMIERVLKGFPRKEADYWRKQFSHPGPVRLRDIDAAQDQLARLAAELADQGILQWPMRQRVAAAA